MLIFKRSDWIARSTFGADLPAECAGIILKRRGQGPPLTEMEGQERRVSYAALVAHS